MSTPTLPHAHTVFGARSTSVHVPGKSAQPMLNPPAPNTGLPQRIHALPGDVLDGIYVADKPAGITSAQMVGQIKRSLGARGVKVGHMGTLDPLASGVLLLGIGRGTKLMEWALTQPKTYFASIRFGWETSTEDLEGVPGERSDVVPTRLQIEGAIAGTVGEVLQRPSSVSALKVGGKRAYTLPGVELQARPVQIYRISIDAYNYPELLLTVQCGRGVYVRALARDIGRSCGTRAHLGWLRRISCAGWWA